MTPTEMQNLKNSCQLLEITFKLICSKEWSGQDVEAVAQVKAYLQALHAENLKALQRLEAKAIVEGDKQADPAPEAQE